MGLSGLPAGQASNAFPFVTFAGTDAPTNWAGEPASVTIAENYTVLDNVQWTVGKHSFTFGGQVAWMLYNVINDTTGTSPITLATAVTETSRNHSIEQRCSEYAATSGTGLSYASFLVGEIDKGSFTQYLQQEFGARFRAISPYAQDDWKVSNKLTLNLGLRYDFFPTVTEVHNAESFFSPTLANPVTGINGGLQFTGSGSGTCNCSTPVNNYHKNFGPRVGLAYQLDSKTVIRSSYGVMFSHGNAVGGLASQYRNAWLLRRAFLFVKRPIIEYDAAPRRQRCDSCVHGRARRGLRSSIRHRVHQYLWLYRHTVFNRLRRSILR